MFCGLDFCFLGEVRCLVDGYFCLIVENCFLDGICWFINNLSCYIYILLFIVDDCCELLCYFVGFIGDIGDICFMDRFIFLWREFLIKYFVFFYFFYWEWILLFWGLDFVFDEVCFFVDVIFFFFGLVLVFSIWFLLWIKIGFGIFWKVFVLKIGFFV